MFSAMSMFRTATFCIRGNHYALMSEFLESIGSQLCKESDDKGYTDLPIMASHEKHEFEWGDSGPGWVDLIQRTDNIQQQTNLLQFAVTLPYAKRRWFSPQVKDWKQLIAEAQRLFGPSHQFDMSGKTGLHFHDQNLKLLISSYRTRKHSFIEIKMAKDQFCC